MQKIDFREEYGELYFPSARSFQVVDVPAMNFAMVEGKGDPNTSPAYRQALEALFGVSYTVKFTLKHAKVADFRVAPLESLWWTGSKGRFDVGVRSGWKWTAMIMQPAVVTRSRFEEAISELHRKKDPPGLPKVRLKRFREGTVAQILYFGPYSQEGPTIRRMHEFIDQLGGSLSGKHHEIYLGDPRRSAPEKLRTILRQPFVR